MGWEGPIQGPDHAFMQKGKRKVKVPNPHEGDIDISLLTRILKQAGVTKSQYMSAIRR